MRLFYFTAFMFKRYLKNIPFVIILIFIPLCCLFLKNAGMTEDIKIKAGIYSESGVNTERLSEYEGAAEFILYDDLEKLKSDVSGRKTECGYYFTEDLPEVYDSEKVKGSVICYKSPATAFHKVIDEIIFSELFYTYAYDILEDFTAEKTAVNPTKLFAAYKELLNTDAVISINYEYVEGTSSESGGVNILGFLRGILGIFIMLGGLLGGFYALRDFKSGFGKTFSPLSKTVVSYGYFAVPALLCGLSALAGLFLGGGGSPAEALNVFVFSLTAAAFGDSICCFFKNESGLTFAAAVLVLASLIFCPVFADTGSFIKAADVISKFLIPTYFIENKPGAVFVICHAFAFLCGFLRISEHG